MPPPPKKPQQRSRAGQFLYRTTGRLPVRLTEHELMDRGSALARAGAATRRSSPSPRRRRLQLLLHRVGVDEGKLETERALLESVVLRKEEERDVEVEVRTAEKSGWVALYRMDTGEFLFDRLAREGELQARFDLDNVEPSPMSAEEIAAAFEQKRKEEEDKRHGSSGK